ncbi:MAG: FAD-dependent oxidoreductase [SAR324 cluster bacterium]|nr:glycine cleavage system protein T [Deltaproteobacteria bacterium]MDP7137702.1 FAD-dependent oxidoreductase [SAR324 cluster bacterium]|tara:strand:+ start:10946 stop:13372 length:2427 start_codon:yes stop_codon:yes gene_type:complete
MKSHAQAVVIGGGVVGCSVLYHLTKLGWKDCVLLERSELTSGSTWHAAGGMHTVNGDPNVAQLQQYTIKLYEEIQEISGQDIGLHLTGGVMLAGTEDRFDWLKSLHAKGRYLGMETEIISPKEAAEIMPLLDPKHFVGAVYDPIEGHLDPSGTTWAYAKAAQKQGGEIHQQTHVEALHQQEDGTWHIHTSQGDIHAEHVVNAGGLWAREVGKMVGLELPVLAMEHMYLLTEEMAEVTRHNQQSGKQIPHAMDFDGELYLRQEQQGMLMGTYEKACVPWQPDETPWDFSMELLPPDLERITPSLEVGFQHFPAFENAGIKKIINGPFTFAPDGNPLVGPVRELPGYWCACAVMAGFSQGGGVGLALANWMIEGDPGFDVWGMDVSRYGEWITKSYTNVKVRENYSRRFSIRFPNEELPAGRPLRTTPVYDLMLAQGAQMGESFGLEQPLWFAPKGIREEFSWRRSSDFNPVSEEVKAVRDRVSMMETSGFAKYVIQGEDAELWLDQVLACRIPKHGRMCLAPMLNEKGKLVGDFTLTRMDDEDFLLIGSGVAEEYHLRWFSEYLDPELDVHVIPQSSTMLGLAVAGPKSRELMQKVSPYDFSNDYFRFMEMKQVSVGLVECLVGRVSYTGDLGYEIWMEAENQRSVFQTLMQEGESLGIGLFGLRALNSLRLEKNFGSWAREFRPIYGPMEAGLNPFVAYDKEADFIGKEIARKEKEEGGNLRLRTFVVDAKDADVIGDEPIWHEGEVKGWVTSGGFAHGSGVSMAMGYVPREIADQTSGWEIEILNERCSCKLQPKPLFDPEAKIMRG